jgi:hypothetical protein
MSQVHKKQGWCKECRRKVVGERRNGIGDGMGCLLIVLTGGLFLPVFLVWRMLEAFQSYRCPHCGTRISRVPKATKGIKSTKVTKVSRATKSTKERKGSGRRS